MPWQAAALYQATIGDDGLLENIRHIAGGPGNPVFKCEWDEIGALYFVMETGEWSQLYSCQNGTVSQISNFEGEAARPLWVLGMRSYALLGNKRVALVTVEKGEDRLWLIDEAQGTTTPVGQPHRQVFDPLKSGDNSIFAIVADDDAPPAIVEVDMNGESRLIHRPGSITLEKGDISVGQTVALKTDTNETIFAVYYPPRNAAFDGPGGALPPAIFSAHGGPTGCADRGLKLKIQYWTNRGFAFFDVDYRGSTGYGATYRSALDGQWGILDATDMVAAAKAAVAMTLADTNALLISGGSAGGFTALMALCISDIFRAATISYGVADLATLLATTHKFEAGYLYDLIGTIENKTEPEFTNRSPLHQARNIKSPVLLLQGLEDKVVPAEQSRAMARAIEQCGVPVSLVEFAGEGHGFRGGDTIRKALECEFAFYAEHLGLNGR
ncbi:MAG: prolyl oligopeptidase family serine peptidase [Fimbriimonadaceae bacterium]|nr:prolyl oligopeptidase family serine peptidase [Alphaproteobacteria bacterium]